MFSLFKQKVEIKSNIKFMQSVQNKGIKIGSSITVPENFSCLIYHNSKFYTCLKSGSYNLEEDLCPKLFKSQKKKGKLKKLSLICHYINLTPPTFSFKYKKNEISIDFEIISPRDFAEFILLYSYKTDDIYTQECLKDCLISYIKLLDNSNLQILNNALETFGIKLTNISFNNSTKPANTSNELDLLPKSQPNPTSSNTDLSNTLEEPNYKGSFNQNAGSQSATNATICPNCKTQIRFSTTFCIRCGYKLK